MNRRWTCLVVSGMFVSACGPVGTWGLGPEIATVEMRNHTIRITQEPDGPRYTVVDSLGELVSPALSMEELEAAHPSLYRRINEAAACRTLDASLSGVDGPATHAGYSW